MHSWVAARLVIAVVAAACLGPPGAAAQLPLPERSGTPRGCAEGLAPGGFAPNQWLRAYGIAPLHDRGLRGQGMRIAVVETDGFARSDLTTFARCFGLEVPRTRVIRVGIPSPLAPGTEASLDVQTLASVAPRARIDVYEGGATTAQLAEMFARAIDAPPHRRPQVVSSSIGGCEYRIGSQSAFRRLERVLARAAARGITVLSAAGDNGSSDCAPSSRRRAVDYPGSSPWVTSVGGTSIALDRANGIVTERVWNDAPFDQLNAGGGGASVIFRRPAWQRAPGVSGAARSVPDVSFMADLAPGYPIFCTGLGPECRGRGWFRTGGTSAAAPLFAGALALVNQSLQGRERPPLGHIGPLLYRLARQAGGSRGPVFRDVRAGSNDLYEVGCCRAKRDYDRTSGLGSLDAVAFLRAVLRD
jgi:subtilase family serine protease